MDLLGGRITRLTARYNPGTALANTHVGQGTDRGLYGALLGWDIVDPGMQKFDDEISRCLAAAGIEVSVEYPDLGTTHASFYQLVVGNEVAEHRVEAISTGGGMFEILRIDGAPVSIEGDYHELLVFCDGEGQDLERQLAESLDAEVVHRSRSENGTLVEVKSTRCFDPQVLGALSRRADVRSAATLRPVLPTLSRRDLVVPFLTASEMLKYLRESGEDLDLWQLALRYESARGGVDEAEVWGKMEDLVGLMRRSIENGLAGTEYEDRLLPAHAPLASAAIARGKVPDDVVTRMILYTTAIMDTKSAMGVFVAAPTAGSCGTTPGAIFGLADFHRNSDSDIVRALLAAGMIGVFIAAGSTFSAELAGCMAETGASGAMAAAGLVGLLGGDLNQALTAAGVTIETGLGLICDMVADRVEVPCLAKNVAGVMRAYGATLTAMMSYPAVIPLDEAIQAMDRVGKLMPDSVCCTGGEGLCATCTGRRMHHQMVTLPIAERPPGSLLPRSHEIDNT
ncbi:MAG: L-serine ammonia-lyase, iron-sulfur-dependent, subunit alpha [Acidobacteriota bacterium]